MRFERGAVFCEGSGPHSVPLNRVLSGWYIDRPVLEDAVVQRRDPYGRPFKQRLDHHHHFVRRIFSRESWDLNGRLMGRGGS